MSWSFPKYQAVNIRDNSEGYRETTDEERDELGRHVGDWLNTFIHEFGGHGFGRLADEYWNTTYKEPGAIAGHSYTVPYSLNVTGIYGEYPWQADLLDNLDEWIARNPDYARIGIYHGGNVSLYYRWRSEKTSCMIDNRPYFSTWQRILIVRRILEKAGETFDMIITIGPLIVMKFVTLTAKPFGVPVTVSMNPIMVDGTGMCGGCRLTLIRDGKRVTRFACVDGPDFNGYEVDFDEAMSRGRMYFDFERHAHEETCNLFKDA